MQQDQWEKEWARRRDDGWGDVNRWGEDFGNGYCGEHRPAHTEKYQGEHRKLSPGRSPNAGHKKLSPGRSYNAGHKKLSPGRSYQAKSGPRYYPPGSGFIPANNQ